MIKKSLALILGLLMVAAIAGCNRVPEEPVELAQGVTDTEIVVGTIVDLSGPVAAIGNPFFRGMDAHFKHINDQGGINGRTIRLIAKDDQWNAQRANMLATELVEDDKVFAIVGQLGTPMVLATMEYFKEVGIPSVYQGGGSSLFTTAGPNFFPVQPNYLYEGQLFSKYVVEIAKAERIVFIYQNDDTGQEALEGFKQGLQHFNKSEILLQEIAVNMTDVDFTTQIQLAKGHNPDLVIVHTLLSPAVRIMRAAKEGGLDVPILTQYANSDQVLMLLAGDAAEGNLVTGWVDITRNEQYIQLVEAMGKYYPDQQVTSFVVAGWIAAEVFVEGLRLAGDNLSWEGFIAAMETMDFTDGLASRVKYGPNLRQGVREMVFMKIVRNDEGQLVFEMVTDFISINID
jgi:branched-chain amino acid transport system substrate-binding protein